MVTKYSNYNLEIVTGDKSMPIADYATDTNLLASSSNYVDLIET